jgi:NADP-dependent 3-hydroxy acid dehydrogenase YdfG
MILKNKTAVIYGAGGSLGGEVARAFAGAGARVFLTGRALPSVKKVADEIVAAGGKAEIDVVDALDAAAIARHMEGVVQTAGGVDISFNAVGVDVLQGVPLVDAGLNYRVAPVAAG